MCNKEYLGGIAEQIKKPAMHFNFIEKDIKYPTVETHLGGVPFTLEKDEWPVCQICKKDMEFFMQMREVTEDERVLLKTFYRCNCEIENFKPNIKVFEYKNPKLEKAFEHDESVITIPYVEIKLEAAWSIPDWNLFRYKYPKILEKINKDYPGRIDDVKAAYSVYRYNNNMVSYECYSGYGGYPEYIGAPKKMKCSCCKEESNFVFQLDSLEEFSIDWRQMTLYCYRCENTGTMSFMLS